MDVVLPQHLPGGTEVNQYSFTLQDTRSQVSLSRSEMGPTEWWWLCWFLQYARYCCGLRQGCYICEMQYRVSFLRKRMIRAYLCGRERASTLLTAFM